MGKYKKPNIKKVNIEKPDIQSVEIQKPNIQSVEIERVEIQKPTIQRVEIQKPTIQSVEIQKPTIESVEIQKPTIEKPDTQNKITDAQKEIDIEDETKIKKYKKSKKRTKKDSKKEIKKNQKEVKKNKNEAKEKIKYKIDEKDREEKIKKKIEKEFYESSWYSKDSLPDRYIKKRKKKKTEEKAKRNEVIEKRAKIKQEQKEARIKKNTNIVEKYESSQEKIDFFNGTHEKLDYDDFYKMYSSSEVEELQNFVDDPLNKLKYREAKINLSDEVNSRKSQKELSQIAKEKQKIYKENYKKDEEFAKKYIDTKNKNLDLEKDFDKMHVPFEENINEIYGPFLDKNFESVNPKLLEHQLNNEFLNENENKFNKINGKIKDKIYDEEKEAQASKLFKEKESTLRTNFNDDKSKLKEINKEIRTLKKKDINDVNKRINSLNKNKENMSEERFESLSNLYKKQLSSHQEKLEELQKNKQDVKSNLRESRKNYLNRENPKLYEDEINKLNKDLKVLEDLDVFNKAQVKVDAGDMTREELDTLKNDLFGESEVVAPKRTRKQIEEEIEKNKRLVKKFGGNAEREIEEDIVDTFKNKLKNTSKFNLIFSSVNAISQYKDSRKDGHGVVGSVARAGLDFALAETLGGLAYMGVSLAKELPGAAVKGTEMLHTEVRKMNTASRFSVFGQAQFQDTQQLATMRQSGMEMAKMANYRLEQTLMGNEAKYLHK